MSRCQSETVFLGIGANLGDREASLLKAVNSLHNIAESEIIKSSIYNTPPVGPEDQPDFLNMCISFQTLMSPCDIHKFCRNTEKKIGRVRHYRWGPREIDIDLLVFGRRLINNPDLTIPHPEITNRQFVLIPLHEIAPELVLPGQHKTVAELLNEFITCNGRENITIHIKKSGKKHAAA